VVRRPAVVFTFELNCLAAWERDYLRQGRARAAAFPAIDEVAAALGGRTRVEQIATLGDCVDGLLRGILAAPRGAT
jgi:hypothetical protein